MARFMLTIRSTCYENHLDFLYYNTTPWAPGGLSLAMSCQCRVLSKPAGAELEPANQHARFVGQAVKSRWSDEKPVGWQL